MKSFLLLFLGVLNSVILSQSGFETNSDNAYLNAKRGIYFVLENIPEKKSRLDQELISEDKLIAEIKLEKETEGIKIESTGYFESYQVKVIIYRSYELLKKEGYLIEKKNGIE